MTMRHPAHQKCHIHYLKEINHTINYKNPGSEFVPFVRDLGKIINDSYNAAKTRSKSGRIRAKKSFEHIINRIISKHYHEKNCIRFVKRIRHEEEMLFTFLVTGIDPYNNTAEQAIRPNVIIRKITNRHRSNNGAYSHKVLMSIKETCRMSGLNFHNYSLEYLENFTSKL